MAWSQEPPRCPIPHSTYPIRYLLVADLRELFCHSRLGVEGCGWRVQPSGCVLRGPTNNALPCIAGDPLLTLRSRTWNAKAKNKTQRLKHELIRNFLRVAQPHPEQRAVTPPLSDWQLVSNTQISHIHQYSRTAMQCIRSHPQPAKSPHQINKAAGVHKNVDLDMSALHRSSVRPWESHSG